jgi:hypothetical protein
LTHQPLCHHRRGIVIQYGKIQAQEFIFGADF